MGFFHFSAMSSLQFMMFDKTVIRAGRPENILFRPVFRLMLNGFEKRLFCRHMHAYQQAFGEQYVINTERCNFF
ncbi:MAG: hypothetical protein JWQ21_2115 [Herminiimonas sp.]|nr:hypothetical protein [Herminiimonas sp.]